MSVILSIYEYVKTCPFLKTYLANETAVYIDFASDEQITTYTISEVPCNPVIKTYTNGDTENQFLFMISSIESYGSDKDNNASNLAFYEDFAKWIKENNKLGILPLLESDKNATKIKCLTGGYMFQNAADATSARYVIQCQLVYDQDY